MNCKVLVMPALDGHCAGGSGGFWFFKFWIWLRHCLLTLWFDLNCFKINLIVAVRFCVGDSLRSSYCCIDQQRPPCWSSSSVLL